MATLYSPIVSIDAFETWLVSFAGLHGVPEQRVAIKGLDEDAVDELVSGMSAIWIRGSKGPDENGILVLSVAKAISDEKEAVTQIAEHLTDEHRSCIREWTFGAPVCRETILPLLGAHASDIRAYTTNIVGAGKWRLTLQT
jgi:hypothetical protein